MNTTDNDATQIQNSSDEATRIMSIDEATQLADSKNQPSQKQTKANGKSAKAKPSPAGKPKHKTIKRVACFAGAGILLGAVASLGMETNGSESSGHSTEGEDELTAGVNLEGELQEITIPDDGTVNDEMTFEEAFSSARVAHGPGSAFEWRGNIYATYTKEEWDGMSDEEKSDFIGSLSTPDTALSEEAHTDEAEEVVAVAEETSTQAEPEESTAPAQENVATAAVVSEPTDTTAEANGDTASEEANPGETIMAQVVSLAQDSETSDNEIIAGNTTDVDIPIVSEGSGNETADNIEILGVVQDQENSLNVAHLNIEGEEVMVLDVDGDMAFDKIVADLNHDGVIDDSEIIDISEAGLSVEDLGGFTPTDNELLASGDDMPNYLDGLLD